MNIQSLIPWIADGLVVIALLVMTIGAIGIVTMPDIYTKLHAASKAVFLGVILLALSAMLLQDMAFTLRAGLICVALILTTPVASHAIGRAAYLEREHMSTPGAVDESGHHLADEDDAPPVPDDGLARTEPAIVLSHEPADPAHR